MSSLPLSGVAAPVRPFAPTARRHAPDEPTAAGTRAPVLEAPAPPARVDASLAPGAEIAGKYVLEGELGSGGMGIVFAARHMALGTSLAIKVLHPRLARSPDAVRRFLREARAASELAGPHVARAIDAGTFGDGLTYVVMDRLVGVDLERRLRDDGPLPMTDAARFVREACAGLAVAHARGFVHRDVKPSNLFLARDDDGVERIKVLDFGIAKARPSLAGDASLTVTDTAIGSPSYMSPEQVRDSKSVDARADVWGLGATLFKLLTGELPFHGDSAMSISAAITADSPRRIRELRSSVPPALEAIVLRCLRKAPCERFATVDELAAALAPFASAASASEAMRRRRSVHRALRVVGIAVVVVVASLARRAHSPEALAASRDPAARLAVMAALGVREASPAPPPPPIVRTNDAVVATVASALPVAFAAPIAPARRPSRRIAAVAPRAIDPPSTKDAAAPEPAAPLAAAEAAIQSTAAPPLASPWSGGSATDDRE